MSGTAAFVQRYVVKKNTMSNQCTKCTRVFTFYFDKRPQTSIGVGNILTRPYCPLKAVGTVSSSVGGVNDAVVLCFW